MKRSDTAIYSDCWLELSEVVNSLALEYPDNPDIKEFQDFLIMIERDHFKEDC